MIKIPISRDESGRKAVNSSDKGMFGDIKKPTDLRGMKFGSKNSFNFKKFLLITISILVVVFILAELANWYRDYQKGTPIEIETEEPYQPVEVEEIIEATSTPEEIIEKVTIQETETGWLNVREGAGTSYQVIIKVYPGESYLLLEEVEEWMKIQISDEQTGWIFSEYAIKQ